jgi:hypothetical protein
LRQYLTVFSSKLLQMERFALVQWQWNVLARFAQAGLAKNDDGCSLSGKISLFLKFFSLLWSSFFAIK